MILHDSIFVIIHWEWFRDDSAWFRFRNYSLGMILFDSAEMIPKWFCMISFSELWAFPLVSIEKQYENLAIHTALEESSTKLSTLKHCTRKRHSFALILVHALVCPVNQRTFLSCTLLLQSWILDFRRFSNFSERIRGPLSGWISLKSVLQWIVFVKVSQTTETWVLGPIDNWFLSKTCFFLEFGLL